MAKLKPTLFITDLDGTLLPETKQIAQKDLDAIERFRKAGGCFAIATGRTLQATEQYLKVLQPDMPIILFNGAAIYDTKTKKFLNTITLSFDSVEITKAVLEAFPDVSAEILRTDGTYVPRMTPYEQEHLDICQVDPIISPLEEIPKGEWLKVLFAIAPERMPKLIAFFQKNAWNCADFVQSEKRFYEMLPKGVTKGSALRKYRKLCHTENYRIVAAGDFDNDIDMLKEADISACPLNAQPCVKEIVDIQLENSCDAYAIAELIDRILK